MISILASSPTNQQQNSPAENQDTPIRVTLMKKASRISLASSASSKTRLCHMCGDDFPKSSLPHHQRMCIRKSLSTPNSSVKPFSSSAAASAFSLTGTSPSALKSASAHQSHQQSLGNSSNRMTFSAGGEATTHECGKCSRKIPLLRFASHFRECHPSASAGHAHDPSPNVSEPIATSSNSRRRLPTLARQSQSASNLHSSSLHSSSVYPPDFEDEDYNQGYNSREDSYSHNSYESLKHQPSQAASVGGRRSSQVYPDNGSAKPSFSESFQSNQQYSQKRSVSNPIPTPRAPSQALAPRPPSTASFHDKIQEFTFSSRPPSRASLSLGVAKKKPSSSTSTASSSSLTSNGANSSGLVDSIPPKIPDGRELTRKPSSGSMYAPHLKLQSDNRTQGSSATLYDQDQPHQHQQSRQQPPQKQNRQRQAVVVNHEDDKQENLDVSEYLIPCPICSRKFMETRLEKHKQVCMNTKQKQRKPFDVRAARVQGTEMEKYVLKKVAAGTLDTQPAKPKKSNWRTKHEAFRAMVIAARQPHDKSNPHVNIPDPNPDYITCPCCDRRFAEEAAKRHMPICKEKAQKKALLDRPGGKRRGASAAALAAPPVKDKMEELKRRTAYKPPTPKTSRSSRK